MINYETLNRSELARHLNVAPQTVDGWIRRGCPGEKIDGKWQFCPDEVEEWLDRREHPGGGMTPLEEIKIFAGLINWAVCARISELKGIPMEELIQIGGVQNDPHIAEMVRALSRRLK